MRVWIRCGATNFYIIFHTQNCANILTVSDLLMHGKSLCVKHDTEKFDHSIY